MSTSPGETSPGETSPGETSPGETSPGETRPGDQRHGVSARRRVIVAGALGVLAGVASGFLIPWALTAMVAWDVAALIYVVWIWAATWRLNALQTARHAEREDPTRPAADLILLAAAVASLIAVGLVILHAASTTGVGKFLYIGFGIASVLLSWTVVHTVFTLRYARLYYEGRDGGADFHQNADPQFSDFAYLAFTVGMTYQVSDTELNTSQFRANVLRHSLLSYMFGTVIIALTINLVAGLSR
jgi:uncharacterized membrane protein